MRTYSCLQYVCNAEGEWGAVLIDRALWERMEPLVRHLLEPQNSVHAVEQQAGPLQDFEELMQCWDFKYPYNPAVRCPHCGAEVSDWREHPESFILANANIGGLLVFHCLACGTTIRQKHFRDHVAFEHTSPQRASA